jgi:hypothetical protein
MKPAIPLQSQASSRLAQRSMTHRLALSVFSLVRAAGRRAAALPKASESMALDIVEAWRDSARPKS